MFLVYGLHNILLQNMSTVFFISCVQRLLNNLLGHQATDKSNSVVKNVVIVRFFLKLKEE